MGRADSRSQSSCGQNITQNSPNNELPAEEARHSHINIAITCDPRGGTPYNGLYGEAPPERGAFFRLQVYKRVGISQVEVYKRVGKSVT